jgi:hypothetical protein
MGGAFQSESAVKQLLHFETALLKASEIEPARSTLWRDRIGSASI